MRWIALFVKLLAICALLCGGEFLFIRKKWNGRVVARYGHAYMLGTWLREAIKFELFESASASDAYT